MKKKLIEVALPLEAINRESAREGYIYKGNPSSLHKWWAQRPLAACRALLFASLVDDPSARPDRFPDERTQESERQRLFRIIEALVTWENTSNEPVLEAARAEILRSCDGNPPPVWDPFCGGGSIPLEAQRLGLNASAGDLNPVAVLITKALIEIPLKFAGRPPVHPGDGRLVTEAWKGTRGLADDVRYYGSWMRDEAERRIGHLYPKVSVSQEVGGKAPAIAWLWARTVTSPNPAWDGPMPLVRSFALSTKKGRETWVDPVVDRKNRKIRFEIRTGPGCPEGTVGRNGAVCLATGSPVPLSYIRDEGRAGRMGIQLMAIVREGQRSRMYEPADDNHEGIATSVVAPIDVPDFELSTHPQYMGTPRYGLTKLSQLFTRRQLLAACTFSDLVLAVRDQVLEDGGDQEYADGLATYLAFAVDKCIEYGSTLVPWFTKEDRPKGVFARQAIPMVWDFAEVNPLGSIGGTLEASVRIVADALSGVSVAGEGNCVQLDASASSWPVAKALIITDPPYYDNVPYADLSDFFYVWLRRSLRSIYPDVLSTLLVPKSQELVADVQRFGSRESAYSHFEKGMQRTFEHMRDVQSPDFPLTVIYAFKQTENSKVVEHPTSTGWETMLEGLVDSGLSVVGTWPMRSERSGRIRDLGSNALASSIALVCRPRSREAPLATRKEFLATLKGQLPAALRHLQQGSIAPVDLAQAAIGPGMGVFSRYAKVVEADGSAMTVRTALGLINQVLDETLSEQESDFDSDTRWALAWFEDSGMNPGPYGRAETLSKAKNTSVSGLVQAGFLESKAGKVRLLGREELSERWDPAADTRLTVWEVSQRLIRALETGEVKAAELLRRVGGLGETARELAYRLYVICERKKWAKEALAYNALVVAWPEIARLAAGVSREALVQQALGIGEEV